MSIVAGIFIVLIVLISLGFVILPLLNIGKTTVDRPQSQSGNEREALLSALNEAEFEYQMKKISKEDYLKLKKQHERELAKLYNKTGKSVNDKTNKEIKNEIEAEIEAELEAEIEAEIKKAKGKAGK